MGPIVMMVAVVVSVLTAGFGVAWGQMIDARRRAQVLEVVKAAIEAGREPPPQLYEELARIGERRPPWTEFIVFTALAVGFWVASARMAPQDGQVAFLTVASTMSVVSLGMLLLALSARGNGRR